jgi:2-oxoglutarate ferredoxin oxidoreductase subunit delta
MPRVKIDKDKCKGCGLCIVYCPLKSLQFSSSLNKRGVKFAEFKKDAKCSGCKFCSLICPDNCLEVDK